MKKGSAIVEVLVICFITFSIFAGIFSMAILGEGNFDTNARHINLRQEARIAMNSIIHDLYGNSSVSVEIASCEKGECYGNKISLKAPTMQKNKIQYFVADAVTHSSNLDHVLIKRIYPKSKSTFSNNSVHLNSLIYAQNNFQDTLIAKNIKEILLEKQSLQNSKVNSVVVKVSSLNNMANDKPALIKLLSGVTLRN